MTSLENAASIVVSSDYTVPGEYRLSYTVQPSKSGLRVTSKIPMQSHVELSYQPMVVCGAYVDANDFSPSGGYNYLNFCVWETDKKHLVGESIISIKDIFYKREGSGRGLDQDVELQLGAQIRKTILLDAQVALKITLIRASNISPHVATGGAAAFNKALNTVFGGIIHKASEDTRYCYVSCSAVLCDGFTRSSSSSILKSKVVHGTDSFQWNESTDSTEFTLTATDGIGLADFVRLDLIDNRNHSLPGFEEHLGSVFIPIFDFSLSETECTYQITAYDGLPAYLKSTELGTLTVRIQKIQNFAMSPDVSLDIGACLTKVNIFDTFWYTRCISAGDTDRPETEQISIEENFGFCPNYDGFVLKKIPESGHESSRKQL